MRTVEFGLDAFGYKTISGVRVGGMTGNGM